MNLLSPLKTNETEKAKLFWIKHDQGKFETTENFKEDPGGLTLYMFHRNHY